MRSTGTTPLSCRGPSSRNRSRSCSSIPHAAWGSAMRAASRRTSPSRSRRGGASRSVSSCRRSRSRRGSRRIVSAWRHASPIWRRATPNPRRRGARTCVTRRRCAPSSLQSSRSGSSTSSSSAPGSPSVARASANSPDLAGAPPVRTLHTSTNPDKDIALYINSPGGIVSSGLAIYDTMQFIKPDTSTICIGQAASMGAVLLAGGARGKRYCLPHARVMIHQPLGGFQGQAADMEIHAKEMLETRDRLNKILAKHTGQSVERIKQDTDRDRFMDWQEAVRYALIDKVPEKRGELPAAPPEKLG